MSGRFADKTVLVTGASRGLGRSIAVAFAAEGAHVIAGYKLRERDAAETARLCGEAGGKATLARLDLRDRVGVMAAVEALADAHGALDVVVNNAAVTRDELFPMLSMEGFEEVLATNLTGLAAVCRAAVRPMIARGSGAIVNVASVAGAHASVGQASYSASKGGVIALTRTLAAELGPRGVRVNAVVPGLCAVGMAARLDRRILDQKRAAVPLGRFGEGHEIARAVLFLASDDASYVIGHALVVDGGLSL